MNCGKEEKTTEKTPIGTGVTYKHQAERPQPRIEILTLHCELRVVFIHRDSLVDENFFKIIFFVLIKLISLSIKGQQYPFSRAPTKAELYDKFFLLEVFEPTHTWSCSPRVYVGSLRVLQLHDSSKT